MDESAKRSDESGASNIAGQNPRHSFPVRFSIVLPVVLLLMALGIWEWGLHVPGPKNPDAPFTPFPMYLDYGINAPVVAFKFLALPLRRTELAYLSILGFTVEDLVFFVGVVLLWHLAGRVLDRWIVGGARAATHVTFPDTLLRLLLMALGVFLGGAGIEGYLMPWTHTNRGEITVEIMCFVWGLVLIVLPGAGLWRAFRYKPAGARLP
jgi:hypothetical protein